MNISPKGKVVLDFFKRRLPARDESLLVFSMAVFLVFSWSLRNLFFQFPALILSYNMWDILAIVSYMMGFALLESALVMMAITALAFLLPGKWFKNGFAYKGSFAILALAAMSIFLQAVMTNQPKISWLGLQLGRAFFVWLVAVLLTAYVPFIKKIILDLLDRLTIFLYLYVPLGIISVAVITLRLLW